MGATRSRNVKTNVKLTTKGLDELMAAYETMAGDKALEEMQSEALYAGANVIADYMRNQIDNLKTTEINYRTDRRYATKKDKALLQRELGYTPLGERGGNFNVKIGFDGYGYPTKSYPGGVPTQMIANSINRGTSFMIPQPFITRTLRAGRKKALEEMQSIFDEAIARFMRKAA